MDADVNIDTDADEYNEEHEFSEYVWDWYEEFATVPERHLAQTLKGFSGIRSKVPRRNYQSRVSQEEMLGAFTREWRELQEDCMDRMRVLARYDMFEKMGARGLPTRDSLTVFLADVGDLTALVSNPAVFRHRIAARIFERAKETVVINRCPLCQRIAASPSARLCPWCSHSW